MLKASFSKDDDISIAMKGSTLAMVMNCHKQRVEGVRPGPFFGPRSVFVVNSVPVHVRTTTKSSFK